MREWLKKVDTRAVAIMIITLAVFYLLSEFVSYEVYAAWTRWVIAGLVILLYSESKNSGP